jgi:hypothetical protein
MQLSQHRHIPQASCNIAAGVKYAQAQLGDLVPYAVVENERAQATAKESKVGYAFEC